MTKCKFVKHGLRLGIILLGFGFVSARAEPSKKIVLFLITANQHGGFQFNDYDLKFRSQDLKILFPDSEIIVVKKNTNAEIRLAVDAALEPGTVVTGIYVDSHGGSVYWQNGQLVPTPNTKDARLTHGAIYLRNEGEEFAVYLTDAKQTQSLFGRALDQLSSDAKIVFNVCDLLKIGETPEEKMQFALRIADSMKLRTGSLYLSETESGDYYEKYYRHPVVITNDSSAETFTRAVTRISGPLGKTLTKKFEAKRNKGFLLKKLDTEILLYRDSLMNARTNREASGPKVFEIQKTFKP